MSELTGGWGADLVFEASGSAKAFDGIFDLVRPGGGWCWSACRSTRSISTSSPRRSRRPGSKPIFRYANVHARAIELIASGKVDLKPLITGTFPFEQSIAAVERAASGRPGDVKLQIKIRPASPG